MSDPYPGPPPGSVLSDDQWRIGQMATMLLSGTDVLRVERVVDQQVVRAVDVAYSIVREIGSRGTG
jgi:hypothetical protein